MGVIANICPENVIFCSIKAIADRKLCPSGYVARISRRQNTGHIPGKEVRLISEYIRYVEVVCNEDVLILRNICYSQCARSNSHSNRKRPANSQLTDFVCEMQCQREEKVELERLFHNVIDAVLNEMNTRFTDCGSDIMYELSPLKPENKVFLKPAKIATLLHLDGIVIVEGVLVVARSLY